MKYSFDEGKVVYPTGLVRKFPTIRIENSINYGEFFNAEISNITDLEYVTKIVRKLEALLNEEITYYEGFGYNTYMIECNREHAKVLNIFEDYKVEAKIPTPEVYELMSDWRNHLIHYYKINNEKDLRSKTKLKNREFTHVFQDEKYEIKFLGSREFQPGLIIEEAKIDTQNKNFSIAKFELGIKKLNLYNLGYENWLFIPEQANAYIYDIINKEKYKQVTWFRENGENSKDSLIGNYFNKNIHVTINKRSCIIFDLNQKEKKTIKPQNLLGEISWAYLLEDNVIRFFFNSQNKTGLYNTETKLFSGINPIVSKEKVKVVCVKKHIIKKDKHIINFIISDEASNNENFEFKEI